jgi:hypothetical protein
MDLFANIAANADVAMMRNEMLEGKEYKAVPMVMLKEGVLSGSQGPTYYPPEQIAKAPAGWNHKPVVVYHPTVNGQGVTATDRDIIEKMKIGIIMNTKWEDDALKAEAWIDVEKANKVDPRVMEMLNNQEIIEVSTGLFSDTKDEVGEYNAKRYTQIASNYVPDHLAVLPDKKGALSVEDGAGLLRNEDEANQPSDLVEGDLPEEISNVADLDPTPVSNREYSMAKTKLVADLTEKLSLNSEEAGAFADLPESILEKASLALNAEPAPAPAPESLEDVLAIAPKGIAAILNHGIESYNSEKSELISNITAAGWDNVDLLNDKGIDELKSIAALIKPAPVAEEAPVEEAPVKEAPVANAESEDKEPAKFVGLSGINAESTVVMNEDDNDFDMIPKGIDFSK